MEKGTVLDPIPSVLLTQVSHCILTLLLSIKMLNSHWHLWYKTCSIFHVTKWLWRLEVHDYPVGSPNTNRGLQFIHCLLPSLPRSRLYHVLNTQEMSKTVDKAYISAALKAKHSFSNYDFFNTLLLYGTCCSLKYVGEK